MPSLDDLEVAHIAEHFFGYGRWESLGWFVGRDDGWRTAEAACDAGQKKTKDFLPYAFSLNNLGLHVSHL